MTRFREAGGTATLTPLCEPGFVIENELVLVPTGVPAGAW